MNALLRVALWPVLFPTMLEMRNDSQRSIGMRWRKHHPPGAPTSVGVTPHEMIATIRRMRVGAPPRRDGVPISFFPEMYAHYFALACGGV